MEILLAIVVAFAVIFFGALISMGNERQRKAIDNLNEQFVNWALQDLEFKREKVAANIHIDDPILWINQITEKIIGQKQNLYFLEKFDEPQAFICASQNSDIKILYSLLSPGEIKKINRIHKGRLKLFNPHPLFNFPKRMQTHEISLLNAGPLFDAGFSMAWKEFTGSEEYGAKKLWLYLFDN